MTAYALRCALLPDLPNNEGMFRPIAVRAPGAVATEPRSSPPRWGGRAATGHYVPFLVFGALHGALPDRVMAAPGSPLWNMTAIGEQDGRRYACVLFFNGGLGGRPEQRRAVGCLSWPSNISTTPVEVAERGSAVADPL